jgi:4-hydroxybenzoate polyprenyltransferase
MLAIKRSTYKAIIHLPNLLRVIRWPNLLIIALTQYLTAIFLVGDLPQWKFFITDWRLFLLCLSTVLIAAAGYIINDYYDIKIDYINKPDKVVIGKIIKRRVAMVIHLTLSSIGFLLGVAVSMWVGMVNLVAIFLLWLYSNQLKRLPLVGNLVVAILTAASVLIVALRYQQNNLYVYMYAIFAFTITLLREIIKDMEDLKGDSDFGCKTLPIIWGIRRTKYLLYLIVAVFIVSIIYFLQKLAIEYLYFYMAVFLIPMIFFIYRLIGADSKRNFSYLSNFCKLLIIFGILSMVFFK